MICDMHTPWPLKKESVWLKCKKTFGVLFYHILIGQSGFIFLQASSHFKNLNFGFCLSTLLWCGEKGWFIYSSDFFHWLTRFICTKTIHDIQLIMQTRVFYCLRHRIGEREWAPGIEKLYWTQMNMIIFLFPLHPLDMQDCMRVDEFLGERIFQSWRSKEYQPKITISWQIF